MNKIVENENEDDSILKLYTQMKLYSAVKKLFYFRTFAALLIAIIFPVLISKYADIRTCFGAVILTYSLLEVFLLEKVESDKRMIAAKIQELFDTEVLGIKWNSYVVGDKPDIEIIGNYADKITEKDKKKLINWYPKSVAQLPGRLASVVCQRSNVRWDSSLRRVFVAMLIVIFFLITIVLLYTNRNFKLSDAIVNLLPFLPLFRLIYGQVKSHLSSANRLDLLKSHLDKLLEDADTDDKIEENAVRSIQDEIFRNRSLSQPVPDFLYSLLRKKYERLMNFSAETWISSFVSKKADK